MQFTYYPLAIRQEKERELIPGVVVTAAPHGAHRNRREDLLALMLSINGDHRYEGEEIQSLAEDAAQIFFAYQGSVTRAMQQACDEINQKILEHNLDNSFEGVRAGGSIAFAVLHNGWLFVCQYGQTGTLLISSEKYEEFGKIDGMGEMLGQSKRILARFYQSEIHPGDLLLLNAQPPKTWSSYYLAGSAPLEMDQLKRRLLNQITGDIEAIVIKVADGDPKVIKGNWLSQSNEFPQKESAVDDQMTEGLGSFDADIYENEQVPKPIYLGGPSIDDQVAENIESASENSPEPHNIEEPDSVPVIPGSMEQQSINRNQVESNASLNSPGSALVRMARIWMKLRTFRSKSRLGLDRFRKKIAPKSQPLRETAAPAFFILLVIGLPIGLILLSISAYTRIGRSEQYQSFMQQAQDAADLARIENDAIKQHDYWSQTLQFVKSAEKYDVTQDSRMLYEQAQYLLDDMDLAARLDFRPALTQFLPEGIVITHIQASSSGVYLLDHTSGSILRIFLNTKGFYEIDDEFNCQPGAYGLETVTHLVDFITLPANPDNYRVMGVDSNGNLLYCRPGEVPVSRTLAAPENGWGRISGIGYDENVLYVLDAGKDAIWMYAGKDPNQLNAEDVSGIVFSGSPVKFLDEDIPDLGGALDLVINQRDVYLLHQDGHMTTCRYSPDKEVRLTECQDPSPYTDDRVGREDKKPWIFQDTNFMMFQSTRLPNASIYILDALNTSLYQFSYQLNLEKVLRPQYNRSYPLPESMPSGFGVSPDMELFLAFDNKLFIAPLQ